MPTKSILRKRPKLHRKSKKGLTKRKVSFNNNKNQYKEYLLTDLEIYEKIITWEIIQRNIYD